MNRVRNDEYLSALDRVAEALVLVDAEIPASIESLTETLATAATYAQDDSEHPCWVAHGLLQQAESLDPRILQRIEGLLAIARTRLPDNDRKEATLGLSEDPALLRDFGLRSCEHLDDADDHLLAMENDPNDRGAIDAVFRALHTIKGMAGFLALSEISELCHSGEQILADARSGCTLLDRTSIETLLAITKTVRRLVFESTGVGDSLTAEELADDPHELEQREHGARDQEAAPPRTHLVAKSSTPGTVRVDRARLDALLETLGELVIAESMVSAAVHASSVDPAILGSVDRLDKISRELQQMSTALRMVPLRTTFRRMSRLVRDVAAKSGKNVRLEIAGEDTELDKIMVDRIHDPLVHALRNAVDHGVETPEERLAAGKAPEALVMLNAEHREGSIHVSISDDGRGLDLETITARAVKRGLVAPDAILTEREAIELVFEPGFSTADVVTDVSGRGVGMDAVRRAVQELRGSIDLASTPGAGTTMTLKLPVTMAIIDGLVARVAEERFIIPLQSIERSVRPRSDQVVIAAGRPIALSLEDGVIPIVCIHELFDIRGAEPELTAGVVVIVNSDGARVGAFVCELLGRQQTVIKPIGEGLPPQPGIAGGAIMPDGSVGLILDASALGHLARHSERGLSACKP